MKKLTLRALTEGAIFVAAAQILSYLKIWRMPWGGSITLAMIPIILYAVRWGLGPGLLVGFVYGILQFMFDGGISLGWQSIIGDYLLAYTALGLGGCFRNRLRKGPALLWGSLVALGARYLTHIFSGYILFAGWAEWFFTQEGFPGWGATLVFSLSPDALGWLYSIVYNGMYMIPEMLLTAAAAVLIARVPGVAEKIS